jgi:hypothetical protein
MESVRSVVHARISEMRSGSHTCMNNNEVISKQ